MGFRLPLLITFVFGAYSFLLFHLYGLQVKSGEIYQAQAESQNAAAFLTVSKRGSIYFTDKEEARVPAAINKDFPQIYAVPKFVTDPAAAAALLGTVLNQSEAELKKILSKNSGYALLQKKASESLVTRTKDLGVKGVYVQEVSERLYPFGDLASHVLGFVGLNESDNGSSGRYGIEKFYESYLAGNVKMEYDGASGERGEDVFLTIDANIQKEAERILADIVLKHKAESGTVIVEDPQTGEILAMGSFPNFDPNDYSKSEVALFQNPAVEKIYEPGSMFKAITMAAGIDAGKITPETTFNDTGKLVIYDHTIRNWDLKAHGKVTMTNVIELSLNTGAAFAQKKTGDKTFREYLEKFGLGDKTGINLPGEVRGDLRSIGPKAPPVMFATASFGQGIAVTPLHVVNAFSAIANGGELRRPYVDAGMKPQTIRRVISESTAKKVSAMMVSAVDKAEKARIPGYSIAGKTGTAQVPDFKKGGYTEKVIDSYVGYGPTKDPRFVILFKLDEPEGSPLAGTTVVPAFKDLAQFILNYYNVPPDRL